MPISIAIDIEGFASGGTPGSNGATQYVDNAATSNASGHSFQHLIGMLHQLYLPVTHQD
jgi:hypothetical protein